MRMMTRKLKHGHIVIQLKVTQLHIPNLACVKMTEFLAIPRYFGDIQCCT